MPSLIFPVSCCAPVAFGTGLGVAGVICPTAKLNSIRTAKTIVVIFSGFIWILFSFTLRWLVVARQECRTVGLVPS